MTVDEMLRHVVSMWPFYFQNAGSVEAWRTTYQETLGELTPDQLAAAWKETSATWTESRPPLPAIILARAPAAPGARDAKTMREAIHHMRDNWQRLVADWWAANEPWWQEQIAARPGIDEAPARSIMNRWLRRDAELLAQRIYWRDLPEQATRLEASPDTISNALGSKGPRKATTSEAPSPGSHSITRLSEASRRIVATSFRTREGTKQ